MDNEYDGHTLNFAIVTCCDHEAGLTIKQYYSFELLRLVIAYTLIELLITPAYDSE